MFWFFVFGVVVLVSILSVYFLFYGGAGLAFIAYLILKPILRILGIASAPVFRTLGVASADIAARADERLFGISRELEIVSGPLTDDFKATNPKLAPDIWHDGRRLYFEVGETSYSVKMDLDGARKRKNELLTEQSKAKG